MAPAALSFLDERSRIPVFPSKTDHGKGGSIRTRKIQFPRCTSRSRYWPVTRPDSLSGDTTNEQLKKTLKIEGTWLINSLSVSD